jgi:hypothetical protein
MLLLPYPIWRVHLMVVNVQDLNVAVHIQPYQNWHPLSFAVMLGLVVM